MTGLWQTLHPHLLLWLGLFWGGYLIWLAGWIVMQKREPAATLSWIMSLALLPVLGLLIYHLFGPQRIKRTRLKRLRGRMFVPAMAAGPALEAEASKLMRLAQGSTGFPPSTSRSVQLLVDGGATFDALVTAISQARQQIHLEYYIFDSDVTGTRVRDALVERARAGVKVRLLLDALGSGSASRHFLVPLLEAGGEVAFFHRFRIRRLWRPRLNLRNHRKSVVIDGHIGFTGGINISDTENEALRADAFHDLHLRLEGDAVQWLQLAFAEDWIYATDHAPEDLLLLPALAPGPIRTQVLPAGPDSRWEPIHRVLLAAIYRARQRVWLATPYFVPGEAARMALTSAALRGLDVRLLVPMQSDSHLVSAAARSYFGELMAAGVRVFEYPKMLHSKALLVDSATCVLGSSNFDNRSFRLNFELCVLFEDEGVAASLEAIMASDLSRADQVLAPRRVGFWTRMGEASARLLSPLL
jgi:cardiolipin synthase